jgi:hypothetical protein
MLETLTILVGAPNQCVVSLARGLRFGLNAR